ncbi:TMAO reductase system periplasmic protein TorT [Ensifer adhaerens]|uniref:TMAO reductase system periplasmic protein TorT n=1 Tax=Ensifer adhaerens TaxID=106592 RepID=UPI00069E17A3|nr:TMAO reductase system periplasmic protein TorT [Ensifer adhaerens]
MNLSKLIASFCCATALAVGSAAFAEQPAPTPIVDEANGIFSDPAKNSAEALKQAVTADDWAVPVVVVDCETPGCDGSRTPSVYTPLPANEIKGKWNVCAVIPHLKDPYWVGQDAGFVAEAKRTGVSLQIYEAGGYTEISKQINQLNNCVAAGADAVIVSAVSSEALSPIVERIKNDGTVVIDLVNSLATPAVTGRALFDHCTIGKFLGKYLKEAGEPVKAVWLPGPSGQALLEKLMTCFSDEAGEKIEVLTKLYGDTGKDAQLALVENAINAYPEMNYILGSAVTAEAAVSPLAQNGLSDKVKTASYYMTPGLYEQLRAGKATCASAGNEMILSRIAIDMAVRALEGKPFNGGKYVSMTANVICGPAAGEKFNNVDTMSKELNLPPEGFRPVFSVN